MKNYFNDKRHDLKKNYKTINKRYFHTGIISNEIKTIEVILYTLVTSTFCYFLSRQLSEILQGILFINQIKIIGPRF